MSVVLDVWGKIRKGQFASVYLIYGTEAYLMNETKQLLYQHVLTKEEAEFNFSIYDLEETPIDVAIEDAETLPFIGEKRLIICQNPIFLTAEKPKEKIEHHLTKLENYLKEPSPFSIIVFLATYEKLDERKKITKQLKRQATTIEAKKLNEKELKTWLRKYISSQSIDIADDGIELLISLVGPNLFLLTSEVDKLILYVNDKRFIDRTDIARLVSRSLEQSVFSLVDKIVQRKIDEAFRIYYDLLKQNEEPLKMLAIITGQFRLIYQAKDLSRRGYGEKQIAKYLRVHPYRVKLALGQARYFSDEELINIMDLLAESDYAMKTGLMDKQLLIELFLFKLNDTAFSQINTY